MRSGLSDLWPGEKPDLEPKDFGWFLPCAEELLSQYVGGDTEVIVELGSWLGKSTRWFLQHAPNASVIAIDHWKGSAEHDRYDAEFRELLWPRFLYNCWEYRDRLIPVKEDTRYGMQLVAEAGITPDLVYVDASHSTDAVIKDIHRAQQFWPTAQIAGDDWTWRPGSHFPVRKAVELVARKKGLRIEVNGNTWALHKK